MSIIKIAHAVLLLRGEYVLQLRDQNAPIDPLSWGFFGGHVEEGETALAAVKREVREELELSIDDAKHLVDIGDSSFFVADVTDAWPRHRLHEGMAARAFEFRYVPVLRPPEIVMQVLCFHHEAVTDRELREMSLSID